MIHNDIKLLGTGIMSLNSHTLQIEFKPKYQLNTDQKFLILILLNGENYE